MPRAAWRWSRPEIGEARHSVASPALMAGLPACGARVGVGAPLPARAPRGASRGAAGRRRARGRGAAVAGEGAEVGVEGRGGRADLVAVDRVGEARAAGADEVVAAVDDLGRRDLALAAAVPGEDRVLQRDGSGIEV